MKNIIKYLAFLILTSYLSFAQIDKNEVYNKMSAKYGSLKSISLKFKSTDKIKIEGSLKAKKGNKYILSVAGRYIYCNGKKVWNYSPKDKSVLKNSYNDNPGQISIDKIFFTYLNGLEASELISEKSSKGESFLILKLIPKPGDKNTKNVKYFKFWLTNKDLNITKIQAVLDNNNQSWIISDLILNPKVDDKIFDFKTPKGVEMIESPD